MHPKTSARRAALKVLSLLEERDLNLSQAMNEFFSLVPAETRGFARELVSGTLRHRARLDWTLAPLLKKPLQKLDAPVRAALRLCCYERAMLSTPAAVAGNEYANVLKREKLSSAAGLLTAIARRLPNEPRAAPDVEKDAALHLATEYSHPQWLVARWLERFGPEECRSLLEFNNTVAPLALRVNTLLATREEVLASLQERGLNAKAGVLSADAIIVENSGDPTSWLEWNEGKIIAQDEGAQLVSLFADPKSGQTIIDTCAAPGGKSTHLAQLMKAGRIIAVDFPGRIKLVQQNAARLKLPEIETLNFETREGDFRKLSAELAPADLVLLDAPCLGTGTLRRRPDAKWNKTPEQLQELLGLQRDLLEAAARVVKPGGVLVYSTCSLESEENSGQVEDFLQRHPDWQSDGTRSTLPHRDRCDGAFVARLRRAG